MRAQTAPQKEGLSPFECIYGRPFLCTNIVIDIEALELTSCVTQLSLFQQALTELPERTPDLASESSKPLFEPGTEGLIKTLGPRGPSLEPQWEGPCQVILSSPTAVNRPGIDSWVHHTRVKRWQNQVTSFYVFTFYLWLCTFQMGTIIYVSLLILTPKILSLQCDHQDNVFLSWAHSYAAFHNQSKCWVCGALPSSSVEGFPWWTSPLQGNTFSKSANTFDSNYMRCLVFI